MNENLIISTKLMSNVTFDFVHFEAYSTNNKDIFVQKYIPTLNNNSRVLITFDNTNDAKGVTSSALGYTFSVYREKVGSDKLEFVSRLSEGDLSLVDYNVANQKEYKYYIFKEDDNYMSAACLTDAISTCWWNWSVTGFTKDDNGNYHVDKNNIWLFNLNISTADVTRNMSKTTYQNLTKYPTISVGKNNYASSSVTCLLGSIINDKYVESDELMSAWNDFCASSELKLLKDRKGNKLLVDIIDSSSNVEDISREQYNTITFSWTEIGSADDITITN